STESSTSVGLALSRVTLCLSTPASQLKKPAIDSISARPMIPPYQTNVPQAPFDVTRLSQGVTPPTRQAPTKAIAPAVAAMWVSPDVAQPMTARTKKTASHLSRADRGPSSLRPRAAIALLSNWTVAGGHILYTT